jgi:hypothetical protein
MRAVLRRAFAADKNRIVLAVAICGAACWSLTAVAG